MPDSADDAPDQSTPAKPAKRDREPVVPDRAPDDQDVGWGELPRENDDWYERERPPHHGT